MTGHPVFQVGIASFLAVFVLSLVPCIAGRRSVSARVDPLNAASGEDPACKAILRNASRLPLFNVRGKMCMTNLFTGEEAQRTISLALPPKGANEAEFIVSESHPGKVSVMLEDVRVCDVFGLFALSTGAGGSCSFTIAPELRSMDAGVVLAESEGFDNDVYAPDKKGPDRTEVLQVREYEQGDSIAQIHWKLSGKMGKMVVKDGSLPVDRRLVVVADKSVREPAPIECADVFAELFASLCASLSEEGLAFRVVHNDVPNSSVSEVAVNTADDLAETIPEVLSSPLAVASETCVDLYERIVAPLDASHVICVSCRSREDYRGRIAAPHVAFLDAREGYQAQRHSYVEWEG